MHNYIRRAITLIESLVMLGIITSLLALFLPAIIRVRGTADATSCKNNLRQMGIALQLYHTDYLAFPEGSGAANSQSAMPYAAWCVQILPYLEDTERYRRAVAAFEQDKNFLHLPVHVGSLEVVPIFICPSDGRSRRDIYPEYGFTHYLGVIGKNSEVNDGVLFHQSRIRMSQISDGISNTILVGERPPTTDGNLGWWYAGWGQDWYRRNGSGDMVLGVHELNSYGSLRCYPCDPGPYPFQKGNHPCDFLHFWSWHPGGAHFLFVDGTVRHLRYSSDPLLDALASRAGNEIVLLED